MAEQSQREAVVKAIGATQAASGALRAAYADAVQRVKELRKEYRSVLKKCGAARVKLNKAIEGLDEATSEAFESMENYTPSYDDVPEADDDALNYPIEQLEEEGPVIADEIEKVVDAIIEEIDTLQAYDEEDEEEYEEDSQ